MENLNEILKYYPKLKAKLDKDKSKIYDKSTDTPYVKNSKINTSLGSVYDFGGTEDPVKGKDIIIVDYDPNKNISSIKGIKMYDKDLTVYKFDSKDKNVTFPDSLEVNGKLFIAYADILKFPKFLKVKTLDMFSCDMKDYLFDSKILIEGNLEISSVWYNGDNLIKSFITSEIENTLKYIEYPNGEYGYPQPVVDKIRDLIEKNGGYVKGNIIVKE
jgi:hypothetical protein